MFAIISLGLKALPFKKPLQMPGAREQVGSSTFVAH